jgi:PKD repeat protein
MGLVGGTMVALLAALAHPVGPNVDAFAAGSGYPVMQANGLLATLDPSAADADNSLEAGGLFTLGFSVAKPISFAENLSYRDFNAPPVPTDYKLRWNFGDNTGDAENLAPSHTYAKAGTYLVLVDAYDDASASWQPFDYAHLTVTSAVPVPNPPVAKAAASATSAEIDAAITFDAGGSRSQDGSALTYQWDFNDGTTASGARATHQYVVQGKTFAEVTVTDGRGAKSVALVNLVVVPQGGLPIAAALSSMTTINPGGTVSFDASQSQLPANVINDRWVNYVWDFGDNSPPQTMTIPTVSHTYAKAGKYILKLQAYDAQGAAGTTTVTITVGSAASAGAAASSTGGANGSFITLGGIALALLAVGGYFAVREQRRRNALIRQRQYAMELARARRVTAQRAPRPSVARAKEPLIVDADPVDTAPPHMSRPTRPL